MSNLNQTQDELKTRVFELVAQLTLQRASVEIPQSGGLVLRLSTEIYPDGAYLRGHRKRARHFEKATLRVEAANGELLAAVTSGAYRVDSDEEPSERQYMMERLWDGKSWKGESKISSLEEILYQRERGANQTPREIGVPGDSA